MLRLEWHKRADGAWFGLDDVDVGQLLSGYGLFVIWKNGNEAQVSTVLYVGRGSLRDELLRCRRDPAFRQGLGLYVTWTTASAEVLDPIAAYLYQQLRPLWGETVPLVAPLPVNLPLTA